jgi:hypothetical protein
VLVLPGRVDDRVRHVAAELGRIAERVQAAVSRAEEDVSLESILADLKRREGRD